MGRACLGDEPELRKSTRILWRASPAARHTGGSTKGLGESMKRLGILLLSAAACSAAMAQTAGEVRAKAESSLLVNGHIVVAPDGTVRSFGLDRKEPAAVMELIKRYSSSWHFEPVLDNGTPVEATAPMHLRVVASPDGTGYELHVVSATFGNPRGHSDEHVTIKDHDARPTFFHALTYRKQAAGSIRPTGFVQTAQPTGTVFMVARVERDGSISHASAEQVNLDKVGPEPVMREMRKTLAEVSTRALRQWTFNPPSAGPLKNADGWIIRVVFAYHEYELTEKDARDVAWHTYIPGPKEPVPWLDEYRRTYKAEGMGIDALPDDSLITVGIGLHLLNPPSQA